MRNGVHRYISKLQSQAKNGMENANVPQNKIETKVQAAQWDADEIPNTWSPILSLSTFSFTMIGTSIANTLKLANIK